MSVTLVHGVVGGVVAVRLYFFQNFVIFVVVAVRLYYFQKFVIFVGGAPPRTLPTPSRIRRARGGVAGWASMST